MWAYLHMFTKEAFLGIAIFLSAFLLTQWCFYYTQRNRLIQPFEALANVALVLAQLEVNINASQWHKKMHFFTFSLGSYIIYSYYTADLTSSMTSKPATTNINVKLIVLVNLNYPSRLVDRL